MRRALLFPVSLLCCASALHGQTVQGVVLEEGTTDPVRGAVVRLTAVRGRAVFDATTDSLGAFLLRPTDRGRYRISLEHPSYAAFTDTLSVGHAETVVLELRLARAAIALQPLLVMARSQDAYGGFYSRAAHPGGFGHFVMRDAIERRPGANPSELVQDLPGIVIRRVRNSPGRTTNLITTGRGTLGPCIATVYLDGMPMRQLPESGVDDFLNVGDLEGVEVYNSRAGIPPQFAAFDPCAVVAFWTRADGRGHWSWTRLAVGVAAFVVVVVLSRSF